MQLSAIIVIYFVIGVAFGLGILSEQRWRIDNQDMTAFTAIVGSLFCGVADNVNSQGPCVFK